MLLILLSSMVFAFSIGGNSYDYVFNSWTRTQDLVMNTNQSGVNWTFENLDVNGNITSDYVFANVP